MGHVEEYAEDVDGQEREDDGLDGVDNNVLEVRCHAAQGIGLQPGDAESHSEGQHEGGHHVEGFGYGDGEEGFGGRVLADALQGYAGLDERGEEPLAHAEGEEAGEECGAVGQHDGEEEHPAGTPAAPFVHIGDGRRYQTHDNEGHKEAQELAEQPVEGDEQADGKVGRHDAERNTEDDGYQDAR